MDENSVSVFLIDGVEPHRFKLAGQEIVYDMFPIGTLEENERRASGLDAKARHVVLDVLDLVHSLRSIGGYDFKASTEEKFKYVRKMPEPVFEIFVDELRLAQMQYREKLRKRFADDLKKPLPNPA